MLAKAGKTVNIFGALLFEPRHAKQDPITVSLAPVRTNSRNGGKGTSQRDVSKITESASCKGL